MLSALPPLPIDSVAGEVAHALGDGSSAVLVAPPGAGKTTRLPLVLLEQVFAARGKIIMLEPRRLAARAAAERMAATLAESVGETIGLRVRLDARVSARTRLEIVTEGVFARMILDDPMLDGVAAVLFDEFHERSLDADLGLALALDAQAGLREDLRILVMSATLDGARVARLMGNAPVIESIGRSFAVETRYVGRDPRVRIEAAVTKVVLAALAEAAGSILVFLPGQGEITRVAAELAQRITDPRIDIAPLYGAMGRDAQDRAVAPSPAGRRKIVLATSIAETSLTIEGVRVVVDSGLARVPRYEPDIGITRLETVRVSRAAADQRRGRAGRTEPGICYRLWEEAATGALEPFAKPEILTADLCGLLLDLAAWGVRDPAALAWLDPPPGPSVTEARTLLVALGALDRACAITEEGKAIRSLALPPRLARMVIDAARRGEADVAAEVAAVLVERGLGGDGVDLGERVERFDRDRSPRGAEARRLARQWAGQARRQTLGPPPGNGDPAQIGRLVASAYPERIAKARGKPGEFRMANGRAAMLEPHETLARAEFLAVAEITGRAGRGAHSRRRADHPRRDRQRIFWHDRNTLRHHLRRCLGFIAGTANAAARVARSRRTDLAGSGDRRGRGGARRSNRRARRRPPAMDQAIAAMARPGDVSAPRRGGGLAGSLRPGSGQECAGLACPLSRRQDEPRGDQIGGSRRGAARAARLGSRRAGSTSKRRPISKRRPARASPSITRPTAPLFWRSACRNSTASKHIPRSPAGGCR